MDEPLEFTRQIEEDDLPIVGDTLGAGDLQYDVISVERFQREADGERPILALIFVARAQTSGEWKPDLGPTPAEARRERMLASRRDFPPVVRDPEPGDPDNP